MTTTPYYEYTQEQHDEIVMNLLKIQINLPVDKADRECRIIDGAVKDIYKILYAKTEQKVYNSVTGKYYTIHERSSKYDGEVKGLWKKNDEKSL
jgi:phage tail tube protein FII